MSLADNQCIPCRGGVPPVPADRALRCRLADEQLHDLTAVPVGRSPTWVGSTADRRFLLFFAPQFERNR